MVDFASMLRHALLELRVKRAKFSSFRLSQVSR